MTMRLLRKKLRETHIVGNDTPEKIIHPQISPLMYAFHIGLAGVSDAGRGFRMVRLNPNYGHVLACVRGAGEVLIDNVWRTCGRGMVYLTPPNQVCAYHTIRGKRWGFAWLWWHPSPTEPALVPGNRPRLVRADARYFRSAVLGLYRESIGAAQPTVIDSWVQLLHAYAKRFGESDQYHAAHNLNDLWESVDTDLSHPWTREKLADSVGISPEHLRRLCQQQLGRGPMHHVTYLRMRRAAALLESTHQKVESIGRQVGYQNGFAFTTAFTRQMGNSPRAYRQQRLKEKRARDAVRERMVVRGAHGPTSMVRHPALPRQEISS
jgi:AraC-like DNA-binding protein